MTQKQKHSCYSKEDETPRYRYKYVVLGRYSSYFVKNNCKSTSKYAEDVFKMLEYLIDSIFVQCGEHVFQQKVSIPMEQIVLLYLLTYSFNLMRLTL